jgi:hypothetical protein
LTEFGAALSFRFWAVTFPERSARTVACVPEEQPGDQPAARRSRLASPVTATVLGVLVLVLLGVTAALSALVHKATFLDIATGVPIPLVYAAVGVVVARAAAA